MNKHATFAITEWEWLKLQLRIHQMNLKGSDYVSSYYMEDEGDVIVCRIYHNRLDEILRETTEKEKLETYFFNWVESEKVKIREILENLPVLGKEINIEKDMVFEIMHNYGMGSSTLCKIIGQKVEWNKGKLKEMVKNDPVSILEVKFLKKFKEFAEYLRKTYSNTVIEVNSRVVGIFTDWQGHCIEIVCVLRDKPLNKPNKVVLSVNVFHLHSNPVLTAKVEWRRTYFLYAPVSFELVPFSQDALSKLEAAIPVLCDALEAAVRRGHPNI